MSKTEISQDRASIDALYILKAVAALLVVMCHTPMYIAGGWLDPLTPTAVHLFFLITGYFLYHESEAQVGQRCWRSVRKVLALIVVLNIFYYLLIFPRHGNVIDSWSIALQWLFYGNAVTIHLWYLTALFEALLVWMLLLRVGLGRAIVYLPLLLLSNLWLSRYNFLWGDPGYKVFIFNCYAYALPYLAVGYCLHKYRACLLEHGGWGGWVILSLVLLYLEDYILSQVEAYSQGIYLMTTPLAVCLFLYALQWQGACPRFAVGVGRDLSGNVYYFHIAVATAMVMILQWIGVPSVLEGYQQLGSLMVFVASCALACGIVMIQRRMGWSLLR